MKRIVPILLIVLILTVGCRGRLSEQLSDTPTTQPTIPSLATNAAVVPHSTTAPSLATDVAVAPPPTTVPQATDVPANTRLSPPPVYDPIPLEYEELNTMLVQSVDDFEGSLGAGANNPVSTFWSGELTPASGNLGKTLLEPRAMQLVRQYLDAMRVLGMTGVGVQISYPLLVPDFPDSDKYLAFYKQVIQAAHQRGFKVLVETSPVFAGTEFSNVEVDYTGLTKEVYFEERKQMVMTIASEIAPDYVSITHEPNTEMMLIGVSMSVDDFVNFVNDTLDSVNRSSGILFGAGNGTWENRVYIDRYIQETTVDFINLHIYPVTGTLGNQLEIATELARFAKDAGKRLVIGETWIYKATPAELAQPFGEVGLGEYYARDPYSFWQPLDIRFIQNVVDLGHAYDFDIVSFFWSRYFFAYVNYDDVPEGTTPFQLYRMVNQAAFANLQAGVFSATGEAYRQMINDS